MQPAVHDCYECAAYISGVLVFLFFCNPFQVSSYRFKKGFSILSKICYCETLKLSDLSERALAVVQATGVVDALYVCCLYIRRFHLLFLFFLAGYTHKLI